MQEETMLKRHCNSEYGRQQYGVEHDKQQCSQHYSRTLCGNCPKTVENCRVQADARRDSPKTQRSSIFTPRLPSAADGVCRATKVGATRGAGGGGRSEDPHCLIRRYILWRTVARRYTQWRKLVRRKQHSGEKLVQEGAEGSG